MIKVVYKVEVCKEGDDFKPVIDTPFKSHKLAEKFVKRNRKKFKNLEKRVSCYKEGNLIFSRYYWNDGD